MYFVRGKGVSRKGVFVTLPRRLSPEKRAGGFSYFDMIFLLFGTLAAFSGARSFASVWIHDFPREFTIVRANSQKCHLRGNVRICVEVFVRTVTVCPRNQKFCKKNSFTWRRKGDLEPSQLLLV